MCWHLNPQTQKTFFLFFFIFIRLTNIQFISSHFNKINLFNVHLRLRTFNASTIHIHFNYILFIDVHFIVVSKLRLNDSTFFLTFRWRSRTTSRSPGLSSRLWFRGIGLFTNGSKHVKTFLYSAVFLQNFIVDYSVSCLKLNLGRSSVYLFLSHSLPFSITLKQKLA